MDQEHPLDNVAWAALTGPQAPLALRRRAAARFPADVSVFGGLPADAGSDAWDDLAGLGGTVVLTGPERVAPPGWTVTAVIPGVQLDGTALDVAFDPDAVVLGPADVPEMLDLVARTRPGPFAARTHELGTYLGLRDASGALVAMAGERMRPPGWAEISAVCTDPTHRGQGLAARLVRAVGAAIRARGEIPFLHTGADNAPAIALYEKLGFVLRRETHFTGVRPPPAVG